MTAIYKELLRLDGSLATMIVAILFAIPFLNFLIIISKETYPKKILKVIFDILVVTIGFLPFSTFVVLYSDAHTTYTDTKVIEVDKIIRHKSYLELVDDGKSYKTNELYDVSVGDNINISKKLDGTWVISDE